MVGLLIPAKTADEIALQCFRDSVFLAFLTPDRGAAVKSLTSLTVLCP